MDEQTDPCGLQYTSKRKALSYCLDAWRTRMKNHQYALKGFYLPNEDDPYNAAAQVKQTREEVLKTINASPVRKMQSIEELTFHNSSDCYRFFKRTFIHRNIPCLIKGLDQCEFSNVTALWNRNKLINTDWFLTHIGPTELVPIRHHNYQSNGSPLTLDEDGRAPECQTTTIPLKDWIFLMNQLRLSDTDQEESTATHLNQDPNMYLKDWHLQKLLETSSTTQYLSSIYTTPEIFQQDLLNNYLSRFTDGDYRFVYWGPRGSRTLLHSDVLNSLSWSYNVSGVKEWTFYIPGISDTSSTKEHCFTVIQKSGETIFVPAGWKHQVRNLVETISINHNWIVPASLDLTWKCMLDEILAVENEMGKWGLATYQIRESMLLGCLGMDVTSFFLMILVAIVDSIDKLQMLSTSKEQVSLDEKIDYQSWELFFDLTCMISAINAIITDHREVINLVSRLQASLGNEKLVYDALDLFNWLQSIVSARKRSSC